MDFINKVGSTIARKAKEAAGISNLNSQIGAQEAIINKLCLEIGKTVYEKGSCSPILRSTKNTLRCRMPMRRLPASNQKSSL